MICHQTLPILAHHLAHQMTFRKGTRMGRNMPSGWGQNLPASHWNITTWVQICRDVPQEGKERAKGFEPSTSALGTKPNQTQKTQKTPVFPSILHLRYSSARLCLQSRLFAWNRGIASEKTEAISCCQSAMAPALACSGNLALMPRGPCCTSPNRTRCTPEPRACGATVQNTVSHRGKGINPRPLTPITAAAAVAGQCRDEIRPSRVGRQECGFSQQVAESRVLTPYACLGLRP